MTTLVIGGRSGIGLAFSKRHYDVMAPDREELDVQYPTSHYLDRETCSLVDQFVYCAGINRLSMIPDIETEEFQEILDVNVVGFVRVLRHLLNHGAPLKSVVAVSSDAATRPMRGSLMYCASKAALDMAVRTAARELAPIRVNAIAPGMTDDTEMTRYIDETVPGFRGWTPDEARRYETSAVPMGRRATPEEVAELIAMVLDGPEYLTGAVIPINGGRY